MSDDRDHRDSAPFGGTYERLQRWRIVIFLVVLAAAAIFAAAQIWF